VPSKKSRNEDGPTERGRCGASHVDASPRGCARLRQREERRLRLETAVPADAGALELLRLLLGEQVEVGERVLERRLAELALTKSRQPTGCPA